MKLANRKHTIIIVALVFLLGCAMLFANGSLITQIIASESLEEEATVLATADEEEPITTDENVTDDSYTGFTIPGGKVLTEADIPKIFLNSYTSYTHTIITNELAQQEEVFIFVTDGKEIVITRRNDKTILDDNSGFVD